MFQVCFIVCELPVKWRKLIALLSSVLLSLPISPHTHKLVIGHLAPAVG